MRRFAEKSRALLDEFNDQTPACVLAWLKIVESSEIQTGTRLSRDDIYPLISALHGASFHAREEAEKRRQAGLKGDHAAPWRELIATLADLFERAGGQATAAKGLRDGSYAKPSPFVELVWAIMTSAVPPAVREYTHSQGAMADAISAALSKRRNRQR